MSRVLAAVDLTEHSRAVIAAAAEYADKFGAELHLLHMAAPDPDFIGFGTGPQSVRDARAKQLRDEHRGLQEEADAWTGRGVPTTPHLVEGATVDGIIEQANKLGARLIVVGAHGKGPLARAFLGSVSDGVVRRAACPVLVVPDRTTP